MTLSEYNFSKKYNSLWLAPPRTGTRGLSKIFNFFGFEHKEKPLHDGNTPNYTHSFPNQISTEKLEIIISVRNPYARLYSMYNNYFSLDEKISFEEYVLRLSDKILKHQAFEIFDIPTNYFVRLENQFEDLSKIPFISEVLNQKQLKLMTLHEKPFHDWDKDYTDKMKEKVYNLFKIQFEKYGYQK